MGKWAGGSRENLAQGLQAFQRNLGQPCTATASKGKSVEDGRTDLFSLGIIGLQRGRESNQRSDKDVVIRNFRVVWIKPTASMLAIHKLARVYTQSRLLYGRLQILVLSSLPGNFR